MPENQKLRRKTARACIALISVALSKISAAQAPGSIEIQLDDREPVRLLRVLHEDLDINIDGYLDEAIWDSLEPFGQARVLEPDTLALPPYATDTRIFCTERGIYVSFDMEQPADTIVERFVPRDAFDISRDNAGFTLDTSGDGRYGYWVNLSLGDSEMDGTGTAPGTVPRSVQKADRRRTDYVEFGDLFSDSWNDPPGDQVVIKLRYRLGSRRQQFLDMLDRGLRVFVISRDRSQRSLNVQHQRRESIYR